MGLLLSRLDLAPIVAPVGVAEPSRNSEPVIENWTFGNRTKAIFGPSYQQPTSTTTHVFDVPAGVTPAHVGLLFIAANSQVPVTPTSIVGSAGGTFTLLDNQYAATAGIWVYSVTGVTGGNTITWTLPASRGIMASQRYELDIVLGTIASGVRPGVQATTTSGSVTPAAGQRVLALGLDRTTNPPLITSWVASGGEVIQVDEFEHSAAGVQPALGLAFGEYTALAASAQTATITVSASASSGYAALIPITPTAIADIICTGSQPSITANNQTNTSLSVVLGDPTIGVKNVIDISIQHEVDEDAGLSAPAGWTQIGAITRDTFVTTGHFWRKFQSGDPTSVTVSWTGVGQACAVSSGYAGTDDIDPFPTASIEPKTATDATYAASMTTTVAGWVRSGFANRSGHTFSATTDFLRGALNNSSGISMLAQDSRGEVAPGTITRTATGSGTTTVGGEWIYLIKPLAPVVANQAFNGTVPIVSVAIGDMTTVDVLAGATPIVTTTSADLKTTQGIAGTAPIVSNAIGDMARVVPGFAGTVPITTAASATLDARLQVSGTVPIVTAASGTMTKIVPGFSGTEPIVTTTAGTVTARDVLAGTVPIVSLANGDMVKVVPGLSGTAPVVSTTVGDLTKIVPGLSGTTPIVTTASGDFQIQAVTHPFAGTVPIVTTTPTADMPARYALAGVTPIVTTASATVSRLILAFVGTVPITTIASLVFTLRAVLSGTAPIVTTAVATLTKILTAFSGSAPIVTVTSLAAPLLRGAFSGSTPVVTDTSADLKTTQGMAGTNVILVNVSGSMAGNAPLNGRVDIASTVSGTMGPVTVAMSGTVALTSTASATMTTTAVLSGAVPVVTTTTASPVLRGALAGVAPVVTTATLSAPLWRLALAGATPVLTASLGTLVRRTDLAGAADITTDSAGSLDWIALLAGQTDIVSFSYGDLQDASLAPTTGQIWPRGGQAPVPPSGQVWPRAKF